MSNNFRRFSISLALLFCATWSVAQVTSGSGTANFYARWTGAHSQGNGVIFQGPGPAFNVGIGTTAPASKLEVNGTSLFRGAVRVASQGNATPAAGVFSQPFEIKAAAFNSTGLVSAQQTFRFFVAPLNNNTSNPSGKLIVAFGEGTAAPVPTGLEIARNGQIHFAPGQPGIPGSGTVTSVGSGSGLLGGPITTSGTLSLDTSFTDGRYGQLAAANTWTANQAITGNLSVTGAVTAGTAVSGASGIFSVVGIGTGSPLTRLDVAAGSVSLDDLNGGIWFKTQHLGDVSNHHMLIAANTRSDRQESLSIWHCNGTPADNAHSGACFFGSPPSEAFRFQWNGQAFGAAWNTSGIDVAEKYPEYAKGLSAGDLVVLDTASRDLRLAASNAPYQENLLGVVSENPGVILGGTKKDSAEPANGIPLALAGRVPVKVTLENGAIRAGDYLTSSSMPGYAMRASNSGRVIGIALTSFGNSNDSATRLGTVTVFVNAHHWQNPQENRELRAQLQSLRAELQSRDEEFRDLRTELHQLKEAIGVQRAGLVQH